MDYKEAVNKYQKTKTKECIDTVVQELCAEMTIKEKIRMLSGRGASVFAKGVFHGQPYNYVPLPASGCKRLGVPNVMFTDGPRGVVMGKSSCFPVSMLRGASFDENLEYEVGTAIAKEAIAAGANYFAGICINLIRNPKWGRAQETYSEDPFLLGAMGASLTRAVQDKGMMACPKHYACNSIENVRFRVNVQVDDRTLHEVYLPHFKKCFDAGAVSVMGAYNKVNGYYCCENEVLLKDILRTMWKFDGFASSDFFWGVYNSVKSIKAGMDIEMPMTIKYRKLKKNIKREELEISEIDWCVQNILRGIIKCVPNINPYPKDVIVCEEHKLLARKVAEEGTVLLKNKDNILPITKNASIAIIGRYADKKNIGDHGSSSVHSPYVVTPFEGLAEIYGDKVVKSTGADIASAVEIAREKDYVVICVGSDHKEEGEYIINFNKNATKPVKNVGGDRSSMEISSHETELIKKVSEVNPNVIVNVIGGSAYVISRWENDVKAILFSFYSGMEGGRALARLLTGEVNPSGKLPFTIATKSEHYPDFLYLDSGTNDIEYGYYHGYTLLEKKGIPAHYPFGFGLNYTEFLITDLKCIDGLDNISVSVKLQNIGKVYGSEVVQVYVGSTNKDEDRPIKLLKGFKKINLESGKNIAVNIEISKDDIKFFNKSTQGWVLDEEYVIYVGNSSVNANNLNCKIKVKA